MWRKSGSHPSHSRKTCPRKPGQQREGRTERRKEGGRIGGERGGGRGEGDGSPWALNLNHPCSWGSYAESPRRAHCWKAPNNARCREPWERSWSGPASGNLALLGGKGRFLDRPFRNWPPWWNCSSPRIGGKGDPCGYYRRHGHHHRQRDAHWKSAVSRCRCSWRGLLGFEPQSGAQGRVCPWRQLTCSSGHSSMTFSGMMFLRRSEMSLQVRPKA